MINPYDWIEDSFKFEKKEYKACSKTEEEIKELLFEDSVGEFQRFELNIISDNFLRKLSVYNKLDVILPNDAYCDKIFNIMKTQLSSDGKDMQVAAADGFVNCLKKHKNLRLEVQLDIFHLCLVILGQWNVEVIDEWIKIFELVVEQLDWTYMKDKLAEFINHLSQSSQPKQSRYAAARIMVALAKHKGKFMEGTIFGRVIHLCQDCEKDVRIVLASEGILPIYAAIQADVCRNILLEKVLELIYDPNMEVKSTAIKMLVDLLDYIEKPDQRERIAALFCELTLNVNDDVVLALSSKLAVIVSKLGEVVFKNSSFLTTFVNFFKELSKHKNDEVKCNFLFNFPAFTKLVDRSIYAGYRHTYLDMAKSKNDRIRCFWITILDDLVEFMNEEDKTGAFKSLLDWYFESEVNLLVIEALIEKLPVIFTSFYPIEEETPPVKPAGNSKSQALKAATKDKEKEKKVKFMVVCRSFVNNIKQLHRWRLLDDLAKKLDQICKPDITSHFFPDVFEVLIDLAKTVPLDSRDNIIEIYCRFLTHLPKFEQRKMAIKLFSEEMHKQDTYKNKLALLAFYRECLRVFSKPAIRFHIMPHLLNAHTWTPEYLKQTIAKMIPEINDAIEPSDESMAKKFFSMRKALEESGVKKIRDMALQAANKINQRSRLKSHVNEVLTRYNANRALEESYLSPQYDEASLEDIYKKESGQFVSKLSTVKNPAKPSPKGPILSTTGPTMMKKGPQISKETEDKDDAYKATHTTTSSGFGKYGAANTTSKG